MRISQEPLQISPHRGVGLPPVPDPECSVGSVLYELQGLEELLSSAGAAISRHTEVIGNVLGPDMKAEASGQASAPEPIRCAVAQRVRNASCLLSDLIETLHSLTNRVNLT